MGEPAGSTLREGLMAGHHREEDASLEEGGPGGATGSPEKSPKVTPPPKRTPGQSRSKRATCLQSCELVPGKAIAEQPGST